MKMKFIPLLFVLGFVTSAHSQITTVDSAKVYVSTNTLVYSTGDINVKNGTSRVTNKGNIKIGAGTLKSVDPAYDNNIGRFVITYDNESQYGQLIIASGNAATGVAHVQKSIAHTTDFSYFGTPLVGYSYLQFYRDITNNQAATSANLPELPCALAESTPSGALANCGMNAARWNRTPIFVYNNGKFRWDPYQGGNFEKGKYYLIRENQFGTGNFNLNRSFRGQPNVAYASGTTDAIAFPTRITDGVHIGNNAKNGYNIRYYTYLNDPFATASLNNSGNVFSSTTADVDLDGSSDDSNFADRMLWLTNPYTSNLDTKQLTNNYNGIVGIGSDGIVSVREQARQRYEGKVQISNTVGQPVGDDLRYIPPMTNFFVKSKITGGPTSLNLFAQPNVIQTFDGVGDYTFGGNTDSGKRIAVNTTTTTNAKALKTAATSSLTDVYQLNLALKANDTYYNNTYIAAGSSFVTGGLSGNEAANSDMLGGNAGIYTLPEATTGGIAPGLENSKLYINVINANSAKVAIPLGITVANEDKGKTFTFYTSDLRVNQQRLASNQVNFDNSDARFYFHDKGANGDENIVKLIDSKFSYSVSLNESTTDRFEIFWKEAGTMGNEDIQTLSEVTKVYKTQDGDYKVQFDKNWKKADVTVFNVLGQLISSEKNINTQNDYLLPINNSSSTMYLIVITNDKGEKVTKKIVK